ncbi:MAG: Integral rane sensor signal transduction histidine kinase [Anaerosolibacter sp.]|uniref:sensor histidine kinase n=1 Tax=Anaerosolibacter sp. TaxID=1872527 RepID=UPI00261EF203|nr:HAMP domain-containing sensor histidine kinase [Anaerosolibacter sp.]MDF2545987.1 Integral rane sensor signal transduction histidine kinase [Anaerosolibacter sp.]
MFKQLRNRFLILNLVIISVMMIIAFASIYLITYNNVSRDISMELHKVSDMKRKSNMDIDTAPPNDFNMGQPSSDYDRPQPPDRSVSFTLVTDPQWNTMKIISIFDMDDSFYEAAKNAALSSASSTGKFKLEDNHWAFIIKTFPEGFRIVFLDITARQAILTNLIYTFCVVAVIMLIVIFFISRFFANKSIQPIQESFDKQKQFIADASHELKTPLAVINTNVDVLLSNGEDAIYQQSKWLYYIKSEAERMTKLTNDLLYLTQVDYSDIKMIFTDFNLSELVENVILTMEAVFFESNVSLKYDIEPHLMIHGNREQIQQAAMILLDNAIKYTNPKGIIDISLKKHHKHIVLSVSNTGEGISLEHIHRVFDRFYRPDKSRVRQTGGYGLGLAIAKTIINQHNGKISVKSIPNDITTFHVELPDIH